MGFHVARVRHKLTAAKAASCKKPGYYSDGANLYLKVGPTGSKSCVYRFTMAGRTRDAGIGHFPTVTLLKARHEADNCRRLVASGIDPIEAKREAQNNKPQLAPTFQQCAEAYLASHEAGWRNPKHRAQWRSTLSTYAYPHLGYKSVDQITTDDVVAALQPIWNDKPETASRVRGRIESVLNSAKARGLRQGENPAQWRGHLDHLLPSKRKLKKVVHHAALPYRQMPEFMQALRKHTSVSAKCLEFTVLTCARTGEALGARWTEIDFDQRIWILPAHRMKGGKEHRVPLSDRALEILRKMNALRRNDFVFPGTKPGRPLSQMTLAMLVRRMGYAVTVHGFRSTFRDWAAEETPFSREAAEMALAHTIPDAVEAAYRRGDLFKQRAQMMNRWESHCDQS